jgi:predicted Zn-dependent protease
LALKDPKAAEDEFEAASLLDSKNLDAQFGVAQAEMAQAKFAAVVASLKPLTMGYPNKAELFDLLAQAYENLGKATDAQEAKARAQMLRRERK